MSQRSAALPVRRLAFGDRVLVAALDFGTTFSGYAFQMRDDFKKNPLKVKDSFSFIHSLLGQKALQCICPFT